MSRLYIPSLISWVTLMLLTHWPSQNLLSSLTRQHDSRVDTLNAVQICCSVGFETDIDCCLFQANFICLSIWKHCVTLSVSSDVAMVSPPPRQGIYMHITLNGFSIRLCVTHTRLLSTLVLLNTDLSWNWIISLLEWRSRRDRKTSLLCGKKKPGFPDESSVM